MLSLRVHLKQFLDLEEVELCGNPVSSEVEERLKNKITLNVNFE